MNREQNGSLWCLKRRLIFNSFNYNIFSQNNVGFLVQLMIRFLSFSFSVTRPRRSFLPLLHTRLSVWNHLPSHSTQKIWPDASSFVTAITRFSFHFFFSGFRYQLIYNINIYILNSRESNWYQIYTLYIRNAQQTKCTNSLQRLFLFNDSFTCGFRRS